MGTESSVGVRRVASLLPVAALSLLEGERALRPVAGDATRT